MSRSRSACGGSARPPALLEEGLASGSEPLVPRVRWGPLWLHTSSGAVFTRRAPCDRASSTTCCIAGPTEEARGARPFIGDGHIAWRLDQRLYLSAVDSVVRVKDVSLDATALADLVTIGLSPRADVRQLVLAAA